jgi:hypothetical protein
MNHDDCAFVVTVLQVPVVILEATKNVEAEEDNDAKELERWVKRTIKSDDKLRIIMMETDWDYVFVYILKKMVTEAMAITQIGGFCKGWRDVMSNLVGVLRIP